VHIVSSSPSGDTHISFRLAVWFHFEEVGALVQILACELIRRSLAEDKVLRVVAMCCMCNVHTFTRRVVRFTGSYIHTCNSRYGPVLKRDQGGPNPPKPTIIFLALSLVLQCFFDSLAGRLNPVHTGDKVDSRQNGDKLATKSTFDFVSDLSPVCRKSNVAGLFDFVDRVAVNIVAKVENMLNSVDFVESG